MELSTIPGIKACQTDAECAWLKTSCETQGKLYCCILTTGRCGCKYPHNGAVKNNDHH